jgi:hypothetical protein
MNKLSKYLKPALLTVALFLFAAVANGAWAQATNGQNASAVYGSADSATVDALGGDDSSSGQAVLKQVYNLIRFAYVFFYAIAVLLVAQSWMQFKQQKYDAMFASMGAALGLFLTPAIIDFLHGLGSASAK